MIKGVNKHIIEIVDTGTEYFEKALLFVKPEYSDERFPSLKKEGERYFYKATGEIIKKKSIQNKKKISINIKNYVIIALSICLVASIVYISFISAQ